LVTTILAAGVFTVLILGLPLVVGVWLPDLISAPERTLAEARVAGGDSFRVIQYWNRCDFYTTALIHTAPDGHSKTNHPGWGRQ